jgi:hypothetical protein
MEDPKIPWMIRGFGPCRTPQNKASQLGFIYDDLLPKHAAEDKKMSRIPNGHWGSCTKPGGKSQGFADTTSQGLTKRNCDSNNNCGQNLCTEHFIKTLEI